MEPLLHLPTLMVVYALGTFMVAGVAAYVWLGDRSNRTFKILMLAAAIGISGALIHGLRDVAPFWLSTAIGFPLGFVGSGLFWSAFRIAEGKEPLYIQAVSGGILSAILTPLPIFDDSSVFRAVLAALIIGTYSLLCAREVYIQRHVEPLPSRQLAIAILGSHALLWYLRVPFALFYEPPAVDDHVANWFTVLTLFSALNNIFAMFTLTLLAKDRSERRYRIAAQTDMLTGLRNRRDFVEKVEKYLANAGGPVVLIMIDIDRFKRINDTYGHLAGDKALVALANCLREICDRRWLIARLGGEEFGCLIPDSDLAAGTSVAEEIRKATEEMEIAFENNTLRITISLGVTISGAGASGLDSLLAHADAQLYRAKNTGRNRVCSLPPSGVVNNTGDGAIASASSQTV